MKRFLLSSLMILVSVLAVAQSASMLSMAREELDKRGLTEAEVRTRLMAEGINPDTIPPTDYPKYQGRVMAIINAMQAEKAAANQPAATTGGAAEGGAAPVAAATPTVIEVGPVSPDDVPQTTIGEAAAESALEEALDEANVSPTAGNDIYGHSIFTGKSLDVFRTTDGAQAPDTYILGEGDEVIPVIVPFLHDLRNGLVDLNRDNIPGVRDRDLRGQVFQKQRRGRQEQKNTGKSGQKDDGESAVLFWPFGIGAEIGMRLFQHGVTPMQSMLMSPPTWQRPPS